MIALCPKLIKPIKLARNDYLDRAETNLTNAIVVRQSLIKINGFLKPRLIDGSMKEVRSARSAILIKAGVLTDSQCVVANCC
jgi:hypothetical protein